MSWGWGRELKVVGAAVVMAVNGEGFDNNPKEHILQYMALAMVQGGVMAAFATSPQTGDECNEVGDGRT